MVAARRTLHDARLVGRKLERVLANFHVHLVGEGNTLEKLLNWSRRASDRAEDGASLRWIGSRHDQGRPLNRNRLDGGHTQVSGNGSWKKVWYMLLLLSYSPHPRRCSSTLATTSWYLGISC